jgi:hypothetical protein
MGEPEYIEIRDFQYPDPGHPDGHDSRLHITLLHNRIEQDDSETRQSYLNMLAELDALAAEVRAARDEVARRAGMKIVPGQRDRIRAAMVAHALNTLPRIGQAPDIDDPPCCSSECAPCSGLVQLHAGGLLDDWVRPYVADSGGEWDWWLGTVDGGHVDWEYVTARVCVDPAACSAPGQCLVRVDAEWLADSGD